MLTSVSITHAARVGDVNPRGGPEGRRLSEAVAPAVRTTVLERGREPGAPPH